jgi:hypothetical protein
LFDPILLAAVVTTALLGGALFRPNFDRLFRETIERPGIFSP